MRVRRVRPWRGRPDDAPPCWATPVSAPARVPWPPRAPPDGGAAGSSGAPAPHRNYAAASASRGRGGAARRASSAGPEAEIYEL